MNKILIIIVFMSFFACKSTQEQPQKTPISVETATYQNWYGGRPGVRGVKIEIVGILNQKGLVFKNAYYLDKNDKIQTQLEDDKIVLNMNFNTSTLRDVVLSSSLHNELGNKPPIKPKYTNLKENEVIIEYSANNENTFFKFKLKKKKELFYP